MIRQEWEQIKNGQEVRQSLSKIRQELKEGGNVEAMLYLIAEEEQILIALLDAEDAKTRKNTALLMGDLGQAEFLEPIYEAYKKEAQRFVKSSYLSAMKNFDYRKYMPDLKIRLADLIEMKTQLENQKHVEEETRELSSLILKMEGTKPHRFCDYEKSCDVILLTNRNHPEITIEALMEKDKGAKAKTFGAGVMAKVENLNWIESVRTYQDLLFVIPGMKTCPMDAEKAATMIVQSELLEFLQTGHDAEPPYYFRIEFKSKQELDRRSAFTKKLSAQIEKLSHRKLLNTTSDYELEIRLIENKEGTCNVLLKLFTLKDTRFDYRKEVIPTSIRPVNAALTVALAKDYMKEEGQVLDPFCGVGTMLIERHKAVPANTTYGIDKQEEAIERAKINTEAAHQIIHYINRNFFSFTHEYLFDEIITNMPFKIGRKTEEEIYEVYEHFFDKVKEVMKPDGILILYSHDKEYVRELTASHRFPILEEYEISKKEGTYVYVISVGATRKK